MFSLILGAAFAASTAFASIDNLACEIHLAGRPYVVTGDVPPIELGPDQIVVRGRLEIGVDGEPARPRWLVRDVDGYEKMFRAEADSLWTIAPEDYLYLLDKDGRVFRHGFFDLISREQTLIYRREPLTVERSPQIFARPHGDTPLLGSDALCTLFMTAQAAVLIKTVPPDERVTLRSRLEPQIEAYREFTADPDDARRFLTVSTDRRLELAIFDEVIAGPLHFSFADEAGKIRGVRATGDEPARMVLWVIDGGRRRRLRANDRVILLDRADRVMVEYVLRRAPIELGPPPLSPRDLDFVLALARRDRALVVRRERP